MCSYSVNITVQFSINSVYGCLFVKSFLFPHIYSKTIFHSHIVRRDKNPQFRQDVFAANLTPLNINALMMVHDLLTATSKNTYLLTGFLVRLMDSSQRSSNAVFRHTQTFSFQISRHHFTTVQWPNLKIHKH
jgi:hypothetical protein